jgi:hypothetical protein
MHFTEIELHADKSKSKKKTEEEEVEEDEEDKVIHGSYSGDDGTSSMIHNAHISSESIEA